MFTLYVLVFFHQLCNSIVPAAPLSSISSPRLHNGDSLNLVLATNLSLHNQSTCSKVSPSYKEHPYISRQYRPNSLPSDPYSISVPNSGVTTIFRNYTTSISRPDSVRCAEEALGDVLCHNDRLDHRIQYHREYTWGSVELTLTPGGIMRWREWKFASKSVFSWMRVYDAVDMNFDVVLDGIGIVGTGRIADVR